jgi:hypothetical protein
VEAALKELARIVKPFPVEAVLAALRGEPSLFDFDAKWWSDSGGPPSPEDVPGYTRWDPPTVFDGRAFLAGMQSIAFLTMVLPIGHEQRDGLVTLEAKLGEPWAIPS